MTLSKTNVCVFGWKAHTKATPIFLELSNDSAYHGTNFF